MFFQKNRVFSYLFIFLCLFALLGLTEKVSDDVQMVQVPDGPFTMGASEANIEAVAELCRKFDLPCKAEHFAKEGPARQVEVPTFRIDRFEVSLEQFAAFLNENGNLCGPEPCLHDAGKEGNVFEENGVWKVKPGFGNLAATDVSYHGAKLYCEKKGKSLPTEAQWEKAARGIDGQVFPWGDDWQVGGNFCDQSCKHSWSVHHARRDASVTTINDGFAGAAPVTAFEKFESPNGIRNMAGNAWEWTSDTDNRGRHILKGGGFTGSPVAMRTFGRFIEGPGLSVGARGFRCVK